MVTSPIVSYGGASVATSSFLPIITTTPTPPYLSAKSNNFNQLNMLFGSNFVYDRLNSCAPNQVAKIRKKLEEEQDSGVSLLENTRRGALFCRSGNWLEIDSDLRIHGTRDENSIYSVLEFISVAISLISIRGVESGNFMCMDPSGKLYATPSSNYSSECVFIEEMALNYYNLYSSCSYGSRQNPWYLELRKTGKPRRGPQTKKRRKASHFLVVHHDLNTYGDGRKNREDENDLIIASLYHHPPSRPLRRLPAIQGKARISNIRAKIEQVPTSPPIIVEIEEKEKRRRKNRRQNRLFRDEKRRKERKDELKRLQEMDRRRPYKSSSNRPRPRLAPVPGPIMGTRPTSRPIYPTRQPNNIVYQRFP